jgi:galactokinase/mevalonate kinase-like predicted kinase
LDTTHGRSEFAELVRDIERYEAGIVCGFQDAYMICHGGLNAMSFPGKRPDQPQGPRALVAPLQAELPFLLVTTGVERLSGSVHGPMAQRWLDGDAEVISAMERIAEAGREAPSLMQSGNWDRMAELMTENHRRVAELGGSGEAIDRLIAECMDSGASAAKLAGAGLGGTVIALTRHPDRLEAELRAKGYDRFIRPQIADGVRYESLPLEGNR